MIFSRSARFLLALGFAVAGFFCGRAAAQSPATTKTSADWAEIEYPRTADPAAPIDIQLTYKGDAPGKLAVDLYWMKADGGFGGMLRFGQRKDAVPGQTQTFRFTPGTKDGMASFHALAFLSPDGEWNNRQKQIRGHDIPVGSAPAQTASTPAPAAPAATTPAPASTSAPAAGAGTTKTTADWAEIEYVKEAATDDAIDIKLTYKGDAPGKLAVDLYWMKADGGFGGMLRFGQRKDALPGQTQTFRFTPGTKDGMASFHALAFLSPDGEWNNRHKQIRGHDVKVKVPAAPVATGGSVKQTEGWAELSHPDRATVGAPFVVTLHYKDSAAGKLAVDLYWMKADGGFGGMLRFGPRKDAVAGQSQEFHFTIPAKDGMASVQVTAFVSPDGDWANRSKVIRGPAVPLAASSGTSASASGAAAAPAIPAGVEFKKSWLEMRFPPGPFVKGDSFKVTVHYYLDPSESWGAGTKLTLGAHGPWIDNPDGKYSTKREHKAIPGLTGDRFANIQPGRGTHEFTFTVPELHEFNNLLFIARFLMSDGNKPWPWYVRKPGPVLEKTNPHYDLRTDRAGNLFTYEEPLHLHVVSRAGAEAGARKTLAYTLTDSAGASSTGQLEFTAAAVGSHAVVTLPPTRTRGTFLLEAEVAGWGRREMVFARVPDLAPITGSRPANFGVTNVTTAAENVIARRLGFGWVRHFFPWNIVRPGPEHYAFDEWDGILATNLQHGLRPWLMLVYPPAHAQQGMPRNMGYVPYPFEPSVLESTVTTLTKRWGDKIWGWEWQNEIVPGDLVADPVTNYTQFVEVGTRAAKAVNPRLGIQLAGGLWPRNFRNDLLKRGVAEHIDVLPVHYGNYDTIADARDDLAAVGHADRVRVWDNETAKGLSTWGMPLREMIQSTVQSQWIMDRWADQLSAGVEHITLFGGHTEPAGNWSYLLDERTPRPSAVTAAVFIAKLAHAKPLGKLFFDDGAQGHLFERDGRAILVVSAPARARSHSLAVGSATVTVTDHQGNEATRPTADGTLSLELDAMPVFVEGASLAHLQAQLVLRAGASDRPLPAPQITAIREAGLRVPVQLANPYERPLEVRLALATAGAPAPALRESLTLAPSERRTLELEVPGAATAAGGASSAQSWTARVEFPGARLPAVERPFSVSWIDPSLLGNLLKNPGFEEAKQHWFVSAKGSILPAEGGLGLGQNVLQFAGSDGWMVASQEIPAPAGQPFLFTMWAHPQGVKQAGGNITYLLPDGKKIERYIPHIFQTPSTTPSWMLLSYRGTVPADATAIQFTPVANGGTMRVDNVRVTLFDGSNFAAEAPAAATPPRIDGDLAEWNKAHPIPLLAVNQLVTRKPGYQWSPENLSGVAYLQWDERALYLAAEVIDDRESAPHTGERTPESDGLTLALQPSRLGRDADDRAFAYYLSPASPGGGSGRHTLYRPAARSGGLASGHLAKDSSAYEIAIRRDGTRTTYEVRLPWSELGGVTPRLGAKLGLSLALHDNDGDGPAASMVWGEGLEPAWAPAQFGVLTLVR